MNNKKKTIPRVKFHLTYTDMISFAVNLFKSRDKESAQEIIEKFEKEFALSWGYPPGTVVSKARVAFYFLLKKMDLKPGGEVIISGLHIADFINMIVLAGFKPVVVDLHKGSYLLDLESLEKAINPNTVLFLVTHLSGYTNDMAGITEISEKYGVPFIEDCSQALNSYYNSTKLGSFGHATIFSLGLVKPICTMNGGMIISRDVKLLEVIKTESKDFHPPSRFELLGICIKNITLKIIVSDLIFKYLTFPLIRLTQSYRDFLARYQKENSAAVLRDKMPPSFLTKYSWQQALLGLEQLKSIIQRERTRSAHANRLYEMLQQSYFNGLPVCIPNVKNAFWFFPLMTSNPDKLRSFLGKNGIDGSPPFLSALSAEPAFKCFGFKRGNAEEIKSRTFFIPMYPQLSLEELDHIGNILIEYDQGNPEG